MGIFSQEGNNFALIAGWVIRWITIFGFICLIAWNPSWMSAADVVTLMKV